MSNIGIPSSSPIGIFEGKPIITSVSFGNECTYIGDNAFKDCISLKQINDDNMIECIGNNTFKGCVSLKQSNDDRSNDDSSVDNNSTEKKPILNFNNLTSLGESAFEYCESLENVSIDKCLTISPSAFKDCKSLNEINIPNCTKISSSAFYGCENLSDIHLDNCAKIEFAAFENCLSLSKITLNKCGEIGSRAFYGCKNLSEVYINTPRRSDGLPYCKLVDINAFANIDNIRFYIPAEIIEAYRHDLNWGVYVNQMIQTNKDTQIIYMTTDYTIGFNNTDGSDSNSDSDGITNYTISYNGSFGVVEFDEDLLSLNDKLFKDLTNLSGIEIPNRCERIGEQEFSGCESLSYVKLPNVKYIDNYAFENCISLTRFSIPDSVEELGDGVFAGCKNIRFEGKFATADGNAVVFEYNEPTPNPEIYNKKYKLISVSPKDNRRKLDISEIDPKISILGEKCFYGCENLRRVDIHDGVTKIGNNAFAECENLYEVHFHGSGMFEIGENIFGDITDKDLKIFVPEAGLEMFLNRFENTEYKDHIYPRPESNSIIWYTLNNIRTELLNLPMEKVDKNGYIYYKTSTDTVTNIQYNWFTNNQEITKIILGENINSIGYEAFKGCTKLDYIYIPDTLSEIGSYCFNNCISLTSICVPKGGSNGCIFGSYAFEGCSNLKEFKSYHKEHVSDDNRCCIDDDNYIVYFAPSDYNSAYTVPNNIKGIYANAFKKSKITSISLPNVINIGASAFSECENLESIEDWNKVKTISMSAFQNCKNLKGISLPNNLTAIGIKAFMDCKNMTLNKSIPDSVTSIGSSAFQNCESLNITDGKLTLGKITYINEYTFYNCKSLKQVSIHSDIININKYAFYNCESLDSISISNKSKLKIIASNAFAKCGKLECFPLPTTLEQIGARAFSECEEYVGYKMNDFNDIDIGHMDERELRIPSNVTSIGQYAFEKTSITSVVINNNLKNINNGVFYDCNRLYSAYIPSTITSIGTSAFENCYNLGTNNNNTINLPANISAIRDRAFKGCKEIKTVTLPTSLSTLGDESFCTQSSLTVTIPTGLSTPPTFQPSLSSTSPEPFDKNNLIIYVPGQYVDTYKTNSHWIKYANAIRAISFNGGTNLEFDDGKLDTDFENQVKPFQ